MVLGFFQNMLRCDIALVGPAPFSPPCPPQHIGHRTEIINRLSTEAARKKKTE